MAEKSGILWTDGTFNPWWGCSKVSPACDKCYADRVAKRYGWSNLWGAYAERRFFSEKHMNEPRRWNDQAKKEGKVKRVFCGSMCDILESYSGERYTLDKLDSAREQTFKMAEETPYIEWLFLTKRIHNIQAMIPYAWKKNPPKNIRFGVTVENQDFAYRYGLLTQLWSGNSFVSVEPILSKVSFANVGVKYPDWVIIGSESGSGRRETKIEWVVDLINECKENKTPVFVKQLEINGALTKTPFVNNKRYIDFPTQYLFKDVQE